MANSELLLRHSIVEIGKLLYDRKLVVATDGNISVRLDKKYILITPSGFCKGLLSDADIVRVPLAADRHSKRPPLQPSISNLQSSIFNPQSSIQTGTRPSSETPMHLAIYRARVDTSAVIHAHPPYATSFAVSGRRLNANLLPETRLFDGPVGRVPFIPPGSGKLAEASAKSLSNHEFCLLARHGAVSVGKNLLEAYYRLERLEFLAQVAALSKREGKEVGCI